jgi:hypothetical protein
MLKGNKNKPTGFIVFGSEMVIKESKQAQVLGHQTIILLI